MNPLRVADLEALGFGRRRALKFLRQMDATPARDAAGRADYLTTRDAFTLALTLPTCRKLAGQMPLDPLAGAAVKLALAALLEHRETLLQLAPPKAA